MAKPRKVLKQPDDEARHAGPPSASDEEALGEELLSEARKGHADFLAGWTKFMADIGVHGKPIGAKKLRQLLLQDGINPAENEFSRGIIDMREE